MTSQTNEQVHSNVMLVELRVQQWTARKMDKRVADAVAHANHVDSKVGSYYKSLLDPSIIKGIQALVNEARAYHYRVTLPWSDEGPRVLPSTLYFEYTQTMRDFKDRFVRAANDLLRDYPYHREEAKRYLGSLFSEDDYPTPDALSNKYSFHVRFMPLPRGADFRCDLPDDQLSELRSEIEAESRSMMQRATEEAFTRVHKVVSAYVDRLAEPNTVFRDSLVHNARELVDLLPALNVTGDPRLSDIADRLRTEVAYRYDPAALRTSEQARTQAYEAAKGVASDIESIFGGGR